MVAMETVIFLTMGFLLFSFDQVHPASTINRHCKLTHVGYEYLGSINMTVSGRTCQRWDSQVPHSHSYNSLELFPDASMQEVGNNCRNPGEDPGGPWCYTTDPGVRWEYCNISLCHVFPECKWTDIGTGYKGSKDVTSEGNSCLRWDSLSTETFNMTSFDMNFCRNPNSRPTGPWCYIEEDVWESCDVSRCKVSARCKISTLGQEFVGKVSHTKHGRQCQSWDRQAPHAHAYTDSALFPDATLEDAGSYCRNPDGKAEGPWCLTTNPDVEWEYCDIPVCRDCIYTSVGDKYSGTMSRTRGGVICQRWDVQQPHSHNYTDGNFFPDASVTHAQNYCRNPDGRQGGPWCLTSDPGTEWDFCDLQLCNETESDLDHKPVTRHVLHIGIDGLHPGCMTNASGGARNIMERLGAQGTYTLTEARTVLNTWSAPGWTANLCSLSESSSGILGNLWTPTWQGNEQPITPVTGRQVPLPCLFSALKGHDENIRTSMFYSWSWLRYLSNMGNPGTIDFEHYCEPNDHGGFRNCDLHITNNLTAYLRDAFSSSYATYNFVYLLDVDETGHANDWCDESYLEAVDVADQRVGEILDFLEDMNMADDVLVILSADHAGGEFGHGFSRDDDLLIPFFIRGPGVEKGQKFTKTVSNLDIPPTAVWALGLPPSPWWTGRVLKQAFQN